MEFEMLRAMAEFAINIQSLVKDGWEFRLEIGERRLNINDRLIAKKGDKEITCYNMADLEDLGNVIYREWEEQQEWYKK